MSLIELDMHPTPAQVRMFGHVGLPLSLALAALVAWLRFGSVRAAAALAIAAVVVEALTWVAPVTVKTATIAFRVATFPLSWVFSHLALALVFFGVITPLGWIVRLLHGDPLARARDARLASYWMPRRAPSLDRYFRQY